MSLCREYGRTPEGDVVEEHTLRLGSGFELRVITYGGRMTSLRVPDRRGEPGEMLLGFADLSGYLKDTAYLGAVIGRYANRIPHGKFTIGDTAYEVPCNEGENALHGGKRGFDQVLWSGEPESSDNRLRLFHVSPHLAQGFPRALRVHVTYELEEPGTLRIRYEAETDRLTIVNFTQHPYFNLAGAGSGDVRGHVVEIAADQYVALKGMLPTGELASVANTELDFRRPKDIGRDLGKGLATLDGGYDHTYVLRPAKGEVRFAARVREPGSGRVLEVWTDQPGMQFYTGNQLDGSEVGRTGPLTKFSAFAMEPEHLPDSVHHANFPSTLLRPGEHYGVTSVFRFSAA